MPGLAPGIHVLFVAASEDVDGRGPVYAFGFDPAHCEARRSSLAKAGKPGYDDGEVGANVYWCQMR
jgi:hypothetical protein